MADYTARSSVILNGKQAEDQLEKLGKRAKGLKEEMKKLRKANDLAGFKEKERELKEVNKEMRQMRKEVFSVENVLKNLSGASFKEISTAARKAKAEFKSMAQTDPGYKKKAAEVKLLSGKMREMNNLTRSQQSFWSRAAGSMNKYFTILAAGIASATGAIMGFKKASNEYAEFDDQVADVMKTTGLAKEEVLELDEDLQKIDTRSAQEHLLGLSRIAGKLGIQGVQDVGSFVNAADKINVALTEDLGGNVEESIRQIGKLTDIFKLKEEFGIGPAMLKIGSTINSLGAASTANEEFIVEFTKRVAGIAPSANISIDRVMGLAATLDQLGQTSEVSSTVYSQIIPNMFKDTATYAGIAQMSVADFSNLLKSDANEAFVKVLEGLNGNNAGFESMVNKLADLGLEGKRTISVLGVLSNNTDLLRQQQQFANEEFEKGTSLTEEFNIKNNTQMAQLEKRRKNLALITRELGENLSPAILVSTSGVTYFIKAMVALIRIFKQYYPVIIGSTAAIAAYTIALKINTAEKRAALLATKIGTALEKGYAVAKALVTGQIKIATVAQRAWNTAVKSNPIGAIIAVLVAVGAAIWQYSKNLDQATAAQKALNDVETEALLNVAEQKTRVELLLEAARNEKRSLDERKQALEELNRISPEYFGNLTLEKLNTDEAKQATDAYVESLLKKARVQAAEEALVELEKERIKAIQEATDNQVKWYQTAWNGVKAMGNATAFAMNQAKTSAGNAEKAEADYMAKKEAYIGIINKQTDAIKEQNEAASGSEPSGSEPTDFGSVKAALDSAFQQEQNILKEQFLQKKLTQTEYNNEMYALELAHLTAMRELYKQHNQDFITIEGKLIDKKLAWQQEMEKMMETSKTVSEKIAEDERDMFADIDSEMDKYMKDYIDKLDKETEATIIAEQKKTEAREKAREAAILASVESGIAAVEGAETTEEAGRAVLNTIRKQIQAYLAKAVAAQVEKVLETVPPPLSFILAAAAGGATAILFNKLIPEFATGKYPDMEYAGRPETGMYGDKPQYGIFNEVPGQPEMVIDGVTTRKLQVNAPEIIESIYAVRDGRLPQYAGGKYPDGKKAQSEISGTSGINLPQPYTDPELKALLREVGQIMKQVKHAKENPAPIAVETIEKKLNQYKETIDNSGL